jgi:histone-lysine N-methyltransferase SUV420H
VTPDIRPRVWKTRSHSQRFNGNVHATNSPSTEPSSVLKRPLGSTLVTPPFTPSKRQKVMPMEATEPIPISLVSQPSDAASDDVTNRTSRSGSSSTTSNDAAILTDATSVGNGSPQLGANEQVILKVEEVDGATRTPLAKADLYLSPASSTPMHRQAGQVEGVKQLTPPNAIAMSVEMANSEVEESPQPAKKRKYQRRTFVKQGTPPVKTRVPGDYTLTPLLLSEPEMAWITCTNCSSTFVQQNAYYTRSSCSRCERHSKLYGYVWPKTEKTGARDEERVMDHRTIHRFLDAEAEAMARGRKRPVWARTQEPEEEEEEEADAIQPQKAPGNDGTGLRRSGRARRASIRLTT